MRIRKRTLEEIRHDIETLGRHYGWGCIVADSLEVIPEITDWVTDELRAAEEYDTPCDDGCSWSEVMDGLYCPKCDISLSTSKGLKIKHDATTRWYFQEYHTKGGLFELRYVARFIRRDMMNQGRLDR